MAPDISLEQIKIRQPDDWHVHLRDGPLLKAVIKSTARVFRRAIVMPNLQPPIKSIKSALHYRQRILEALPENLSFTPLMTVYLTDDLSPQVLKSGHKQGVFTAAKLYPANSTTNSADGVTDLKAIDNILETMQEIDLPLLIHGEVIDPDVDIFDREAKFIEKFLIPLLDKYPELRVVLEHITTQEAVSFVSENSKKIAATITPHHLHINRNAMFSGGIRSDFYCLPVAKRERHRIALRKAATSGKPCFFLGTDSAPHTRKNKQSTCGCAGIFNAPNALESYAEVFEQEGALQRLEDFASKFGPAFYGLPMNTGSVTLKRRRHLIPEYFQCGNKFDEDYQLVPFHSGDYLNWCIDEVFSE